MLDVDMINVSDVRFVALVWRMWRSC